MADSTGNSLVMPLVVGANVLIGAYALVKGDANPIITAFNFAAAATITSWQIEKCRRALNEPSIVITCDLEI